MFQLLTYSASSGLVSWMSGRNSLEIYLGSGITFLSTIQFRNIGGLSSILAILCYNYLRNINDNRGRSVFVRSRDVVDPVRRHLAMRIEKIVSETSSLTSAQYIPTLLAANTWTNIILLMIKQRLTLRFNDSFFTRDTLNTDDGGTVSVDWFDEASALPDSAPVSSSRIPPHSVGILQKNDQLHQRGQETRLEELCVQQARTRWHETVLAQVQPHG